MFKFICNNPLFKKTGRSINLPTNICRLTAFCFTSHACIYADIVLPQRHILAPYNTVMQINAHSLSQLEPDLIYWDYNWDSDYTWNIWGPRFLRPVLDRVCLLLYLRPRFLHRPLEWWSDENVSSCLSVSLVFVSWKLKWFSTSCASHSSPVTLTSFTEISQWRLLRVSLWILNGNSANTV
jgi:hypothetical protein